MKQTYRLLLVLGVIFLTGCKKTGLPPITIIEWTEGERNLVFATKLEAQFGVSLRETPTFKALYSISKNDKILEKELAFTNRDALAFEQVSFAKYEMTPNSPYFFYRSQNVRINDKEYCYLNEFDGAANAYTIKKLRYFEDVLPDKTLSKYYYVLSQLTFAKQ